MVTTPSLLVVRIGLFPISLIQMLIPLIPWFFVAVASQTEQHPLTSLSPSPQPLIPALFHIRNSTVGLDYFYCCTSHWPLLTQEDDNSRTLFSHGSLFVSSDNPRSLFISAGIIYFSSSNLQFQSPASQSFNFVHFTSSNSQLHTTNCLIQNIHLDHPHGSLFSVGSGSFEHIHNT